MTRFQIQAHKNAWYKENAPLGKELGYPACCIQAFCDQPPIVLQMSTRTPEDVERYRAGCIHGIFTGFIPCSIHAKQILAGEITIHSLIKNRNPSFALFPNFK